MKIVYNVLNSRAEKLRYAITTRECHDTDRKLHASPLQKLTIPNTLVGPAGNLVTCRKLQEIIVLRKKYLDTVEV